jgi:hypothetical protein
MAAGKSHDGCDVVARPGSKDRRRPPVDDVAEVIGDGGEARFGDDQHTVQARKRIEVSAPICRADPALLRVGIPHREAVRTQPRKDDRPW